MSKSTSSPQRSPSEQPPEARNVQSQKVLGAGMTLAVTVGLFAYGGLWLDRQLGTRPWLLLLLVVCGIAGGMLHLIRVAAPDMWPFDKPAKKGGDPDSDDDPGGDAADPNAAKPPPR